MNYNIRKVEIRMYVFLFERKNMVVNYLEKIREKYQEERYEINAELTSALNRQKENTEIIKLLEVNDDPNFESFTPRQVNSFNKTKILELKEEKKEILILIDELKNKLEVVDKDIEEVTTVIRVAKEQYKG